jgi:2-polyprenyl-6-methoxyphenol hydroxylase-like FAD-dependent oxidoreductase
MPTKRVRAAIIGGGIGGLSAANALLLRGIDVTVFEQVDTLREVGTGVSIFPNGRRQLERMGLKEALAQVGAKVGDGSEYYRMDGTVVGPILTSIQAAGMVSMECTVQTCPGYLPRLFRGPRYGQLIAALGSNKMPMWRN